MKKGILAVLLMFGLGLSTVVAQEEEEITDKDLWKYAMMTEVIEEMKKDISVEVNNLIKAQEGMDGRRFKELSATKGDKAALDALGAQEFEIKFLEIVDELKADRIEAIKLVNTALATKMVGDKGKKFKAIQDGLKNDAELKARYEQFAKQITFIDIDGI